MINIYYVSPSINNHYLKIIALLVSSTLQNRSHQKGNGFIWA